jgi:hypothetical protein
MMMARSVTVAATLTLLLGCGGDSADDPAPATADEPAAPAATAASSMSVDESADVRLTRDRFERWVATLEELNRVARTDPAIADAIGTDSNESMEEAAERMKAHPEIVTALRSHGFTPESYNGFMSNMIYAMGAHSARQAGQELPGTYPVNEEDVEFIAANQAWVQEQWRRVEQLQ